MYPPRQNFFIHTEIYQGKTGDCYLLAALQALIRNPSTQHYLESLFSISAENQLILTIPHNSFSVNLKNVGKETLQKRGYLYAYNKALNQDNFVISEEKLKDIIEKAAVWTPSLGVKILEDLIPYYFTLNWTKNNSMTSISAHSLKKRLGPSCFSLERFLGEILQLSVQQMTIYKEYSKLESCIKQPIIVSLLTELKDCRHVYTLKKIINDNYFLINPQTNRVEKFPFEKLFNREPIFTVYSLKKKKIIKRIKKIITDTSEFENALAYGKNDDILEQLQSETSLETKAQCAYPFFLSNHYYEDSISQESHHMMTA